MDEGLPEEDDISNAQFQINKNIQQVINRYLTRLIKTLVVTLCVEKMQNCGKKDLPLLSTDHIFIAIQIHSLIINLHPWV